MLVLKIRDGKSKRKFNFFKRKKKRFDCSSIVIDNVVFYVVELEGEDVTNKDIIMLLNKFKGNVLDTSDSKVDAFIAEYLYNPQNYIKRALLSAVTKELKSKNEVFDIIIYDNHFLFNPELLGLIDCCRYLCINGIVSGETNRFKDYCLYQYGLDVFINDSSMVSKKVVIIDFNKLVNSICMDVEINGDVINIYGDQAYFATDDRVKILTDSGVSLLMACAAIPKISFEKVYIKHK